MIKKSWAVKIGNTHYSLDIQEPERRLFSFSTDGGRYSELGGYVSFEDFLKGEMQDWLEKIYGKEALDEMIDSVKQLL